MTVVDTWNEIEAWLAAHAPAMLDDLRPPADRVALERLRDAIGVLPESYLASLSVHDGQESNALIGGYRLESADEVIREYRMMLDLKERGDFDPELDDVVVPDRGVRKVWWHEDWIPIATDQAGHELCLDLAPADDGIRGQIITWSADRDHRELVAPDFTTWLGLALDAMKRGDVDVHDLGHGILHLKYRGWTLRGPSAST